MSDNPNHIEKRIADLAASILYTTRCAGWVKPDQKETDLQGVNLGRLMAALAAREPDSTSDARQLAVAIARQFVSAELRDGEMVLAGDIARIADRVRALEERAGTYRSPVRRVGAES